ncbi:MAG: hypothetical protein KDJ86_20065 [Bauldia sp.]|uniref:hypothetical protein n=1 Tax=Bauldia sp. TaxID=2575872 RepID=UPI001D91B9D1|nr:hypothetical protein [Bauldia sp.]MCB1498091.1 hypothetical protein [Bauldia sp.]
MNRMKTVIGLRRDGLGARLMTIANGLRLARLLDVPFCFAWISDKALANIEREEIDYSIPFPDDTLNIPIFDSSAMAEAGARFGTIDDCLLYSEPYSLFADSASAMISRSEVSSADAVLCSCAHFQRFDDEPYMEARSSLSNAFGAVYPNARIALRAAGFLANHDLRSALGVHVRRGDLLEHPIGGPHRNRVVDLPRYFRLIDRIGESRPLFLCTEASDVIEAFHARYPGRVTTFPATSWDRSSPAAVADAFAEILLLSETATIIAGNSAFSRAAAGRGMKPLLMLREVDVAENDLVAANELLHFGHLDHAALLLDGRPERPDDERGRAAKAKLERLQAARRAG